MKSGILYKVAILLAVATLSSCDEDTTAVTKVLTAQEYNTIMETSDKALNNLGYSSKNSLAQTGKFVLFDSHRGCSIIGESGYGFRTEKDSRDDKIDKHDRCLACEKEWIQHKKR